MDKFYVDQWNKNKDKLEQWFRNLDDIDRDVDYVDIVKKLFEVVIIESKYSNGYNVDNLVVIDHGNYQGTQLFIIPENTYQPDEDDYVFLSNYYGSCSGCDTLLSILGYSDKPFDDEEVKDLMTLSLHLVQSIKPLVQEE